ncbi:MAG: hypothetical protein ACLPR9_02495 [Acidimicrobiales bacterium]|jgi:hypothetical protein
MSQEGLDPREFLERLQGAHRTLRWAPLPPAPATRRWSEHPMTGEESLHYLHDHWALPDHVSGTETGGGVRGRIAGLAGRLTFRALGRYLHEERELLAHMVRMNEALARRCDELARAIADRQVADAENQARLAAWLQAEPPPGSRGEPGPVGEAVH